MRRYSLYVFVLTVFAGLSAICLPRDAVANGVWTTGSDSPSERRGVAAAALNGVLYVIGGAPPGSTSSVGTLEAYDPLTNAWTTKASMVIASQQLAAGVIDGVLYAVGGGGCCGAFGFLQAYDPGTNSWSLRAGMPTPRYSPAAGVVNGILYVAGGGSGFGSLYANLEAYDPGTNSWTTKTPMPTGRSGLGIGVVNGVLYAVGGANLSGTALSIVEAYDPATNTWVSKASMPTARSGLTVAVIEGILYAIGGTNAGGALAAVESYNPATDTWAIEPSMPDSRHSLASGVLNSLLYVVGGSLPVFPDTDPTSFLTMQAFKPDNVAPTSNASTSPAANGAGWNNSPVDVSLTATDNADGSGVQAIIYSINGGAATTISGAAGSLAVSAQGVNTITYHALDNAGNAESSNNLVVRVDYTGPLLALPGTITVPAITPAGANVSYTATATDNSGATPPVACAPASGSVFPIGATTVNCSATDAAGNSSSGSFVVAVNGPDVQMANLIALVSTFNLAQGLTNSFDTKLQNAIDALNAAKAGAIASACNMLSAFINSVNAQSGKELTLAQAAMLVAGADQTKAALGCP